MSKNNVVKLAVRDTIIDPLTELPRSGAEQLIYQAVEAKLLELLAEHAERRTEDGKAGVVRNGHLPARKLQTGLGPVTVKIPKVRAKTGEPVTFRSALVPPYVRKTKSLETALPWLYLNERGEKHFLAIEDGVRESTQSWREVLLKLKSRGLTPPKLAIGDGAMGFRAALEEVYPETRQQRCWMHKTMNVLHILFIG